MVGKDTPMRVNSLEGLLEAYTAFSNNQVEKYKADMAKLGQPVPKIVQPDDFLSFIVKRTKLNPFDLIDPYSTYLVETVQYMDGDMGLNLPGAYPEVPGLFFEAVRALRTARAKARKYLKEKESNGQPNNKHKGGLRK